MNALKTLTALAVTGLAAQGAHAALVDDFNGPLVGYTSTVVLDANGGAANTAAWTTIGGEIALDTTAYDGIEQVALIKDGLTLNVGEEVQLDVADISVLGNRSLGLYVGGTALVAGTRNDFITVYGNGPEATSKVYSRGFDGLTEYANNPNQVAPDAVIMFIARTAANEFEAGFYSDGGATRNVITTRTPAVATGANYVGIYADVRAAGIVSGGDNLRIVPVPEPGSLALLGLGGLALIRRRRA